MSSSLFSLLAQSGTGSDWNWFLIFIIFVVILTIALVVQARFSKKDAAEFEHHEEESHYAESEPASTAIADPEPVLEPEVESEPEPEAANPPEGAAAPLEAAVEPPADPDDFKKLEGIGPKVASLLHKNGITTFAQLAATPVETLDEILDANKLHMMHPGSWPQQAKLAAKADWEGLEKLQEELQGGR